LLLVGLACVVVILLSVGVFAYKRSRERQAEVDNEVLPPPAPKLLPAPSRGIEPLIVPPEKVDASVAPKDAGPKDARDADE
jgi:hypothetical protein